VTYADGGAAPDETLLAAGSRVLVTDAEGRTRTGRELAEQVGRLAGALAGDDLAGTKIGLWHTNSLAAVEASLAVEWLGATRVPVDPGAAAAEAIGIWDAAGVSAVLVDTEHAAKVAADTGGAAAGEVSEGNTGEVSAGTSYPVLVHDDDAPLAGPHHPPVRDVPAGRTHLLYPRAVQGGRLLAVPISYGNWEATMAANIALYRGGGYGPGFDDGERFLTIQQVMHGTGLVGTFPFLRMGLPQLILRSFDAGQVLDVLRAGEVTSTMMVTGMVTRLAAVAAERPGGLGRLRRLVYGGAPLPPGDLAHAARTLRGDDGGDVLVQIYGRLEGGWPLTVLGQGDHRAIADGDTARAGSCGRPVPEAGELRLRPSGEVVVRSPMVVGGYADTGGWCSLGDVGRLDDAGYLHLQGRLDRMINTGYHVYPQEIEEAISRVPGVADVLVRGEPDEAHGMAVVAYLVPRGLPPRSLTEAVDAELRSRFARYKVPRRYVVADALPGDSEAAPAGTTESEG
jgi:acyl-CoA synthetase (AMP-forming)/AMP-acid ligase II